MVSLILGILAGALTTFSFVPQVIKMYKTKNVHDLSIVTFTMLSAGVSLWLVYGILINELPVIIANATTLVLVAAIIIMKIKYR